MNCRTPDLNEEGSKDMQSVKAKLTDGMMRKGMIALIRRQSFSYVLIDSFLYALIIK